MNYIWLFLVTVLTPKTCMHLMCTVYLPTLARPALKNPLEFSHSNRYRCCENGIPNAEITLDHICHRRRLPWLIWAESKWIICFSSSSRALLHHSLLHLCPQDHHRLLWSPLRCTEVNICQLLCNNNLYFSLSSFSTLLHLFSLLLFVIVCN